MDTTYVVENSQNKKTGPVVTTGASQVTCPKDCVFYRKCYANVANTGFQTARINKNAASDEATADMVIQQESDKIRALPDTVAGRPCRLHVVGDCLTPGHAKTLASACADRKLIPWTYTHSWNTIEREAWGKISVLASCENLTQVEQALAVGYAASIVRGSEQLPNGKHGTLRIITCPEQTHNVKCVDCRLCFNDTRLRDSRTVIRFIPHSNRQQVNSVLENIPVE